LNRQWCKKDGKYIVSGGQKFKYIADKLRDLGRTISPVGFKNGAQKAATA